MRLNKYSGAFAFIIAALFALVAAIGCGGGGGVNSGQAGNGQLQVNLADGVDPDVTAVDITIDRIEAHINGEWTGIDLDPPKSFDLLDLVIQDATLGTVTLPAGKYTQVRFFPSTMTVTDATGTHDVVMGGAEQTGIKVNVNYDIEPNTITVVLLDFNVSKSLIKQGNGQYRLQPVIPGVVKVLSGTISGDVTLAGTAVQGAEVTVTYTAGTNYVLGTEVNSTATLADGSFKVWALLPGTYTVDVTYTDSASVTTTATKTGVVVVAGQDTDVGTLALQ